MEVKTVKIYLVVVSGVTERLGALGHIDGALHHESCHIRLGSRELPQWGPEQSPGRKQF